MGMVVKYNRVLNYFGHDFQGCHLKTSFKVLDHSFTLPFSVKMDQENQIPPLTAEFSFQTVSAELR